jgi:hypothetical protein
VGGDLDFADRGRGEPLDFKSIGRLKKAIRSAKLLRAAGVRSGDLTPELWRLIEPKLGSHSATTREMTRILIEELGR